jgi:phage pi2 protein 07
MKEFVQGTVLQTTCINSIQEGPTLSEKSNSSTSEGGWIFYVLNTLSTWILTQPQQPVSQHPYSEEELWQDWEWILSKTEVKSHSTISNFIRNSRISKRLKILRESKVNSTT